MNSAANRFATAKGTIRKGLILADVEQIAAECKHHWMIESPNGPTSLGVCKICGERSEFNNSVQGSGWDRANVQGRRMRQAKQ